MAACKYGLSKNFLFIHWKFKKCLQCILIISFLSPSSKSFCASWMPASKLLVLFGKCFYYNLLSPVSSAHRHIGVDPSPGAWATNQWPHPQGKIALSSFSTISSHECLSKEWDFASPFLLHVAVLTGLYSWPQMLNPCLQQSWHAHWTTFQSSAPYRPALTLFPPPLPWCSLSLRTEQIFYLALSTYSHLILCSRESLHKH